MTEGLQNGTEFVEVTWQRAAIVWWSLFWRTFLFTFLGAFIASSIVGIFLGAAGVDEKTSMVILQATALIISVPISIVITGMVLSKKFQGFRIALVRDNPPGIGVTG
jgi:hypothetical protein